MDSFSSDDDDGAPMPVSREPDAQLFKDVKAFAAQLGFASSAGMASMDDPAFDDFAPEKANKKVAKQQSKDAKDKKKAAEEEKKPQGKDAAAKEQPKPRQQPHQSSVPAFEPLPEYKKDGAPPRSLLKREDEGHWYEIAAKLPKAGTGAAAAKSLEKDLKALDTKRQRGQELLAAEAAAFEAAAARQKSGSNLQWLQQAQRGGTTSDKVAAMAVLVQESPIANLRSLDGLIGMSGKRGGARAVVGTALDALKELWLEVLLPADRKLKFFEQQPLALIKPGRDGDLALMLWTFEDALKKRYAAFIEALDGLSRDNLEFVKDRASKTAFDLLSACPEGEGSLLSTLVNKLGDPSRKLASKVGYLLTTLLARHPGMKAVVVREVESFAFRPGLADRARYYAVVFLNQMVLTHKDAPVGGVSLARRLVDLYFTLFKLVMEGKVGTAAALAAQKREKAKKEADARAAKRGKKKAAAVDAKKGGGDESGDDDEKESQQRGGEMDARMLSALITGVRRAFPFVAAEEVEPLIEAHADALFRLTHNAGSLGVATQALLLLHQLMTSRNSVSDRFYRALYAVLASPELTNSTKAPMFLALLYKAVKADVSPRRVAAFVKRLLQVAVEAPANFACGVLVLVSELLKSRPGLWNSVLQPEDRDTDAVEKFVDFDDEEEEKKKKGARMSDVVAMDIDVLGSDSDAEDGAAEKHSAQRANGDIASKPPAAAAEKDGWPAAGSYDMRKREPQYANAERSCFWELLPLASHSHPSVAAMARTILAGANVSYDGDPLRDLTLHAFLDKFIQKKAKAGARGDSLMQPLRATAGAGGAATGAVAAAAVGAALSELDNKDVAPDDAFFYKFYSMQAVQARAGKKKKKTAAGDEDEELVSDAEEGSEDSDAMDDFLAGEEEGGDEGIGADPDRSLDYDYDQLAAAMGEDSGLEDDDSESDDDDDSDEEEKDGEEGDESESGSDEEGSLGGAEFSDLSMSEDEEEQEEEELEESGEEEETEDEGDSDIDFDSLSDLTDSGSDGAESDADADADAEVAALMAAVKKQSGKGKGRKRGREVEEESDDDEAAGLNPFELATATDSDVDEEGSDEEELEEDEEGSSSSSDDDDDGDIALEDLDEDISEDSEDEDAGKKGRKKSKDQGSIFASAADYDDLIGRDLKGEVEEEEAEAAKSRAGFRSSSRGGRGGRGRGRGQGRKGQRR